MRNYYIHFLLVAELGLIPDGAYLNTFTNEVQRNNILVLQRVLLPKRNTYIADRLKPIERKREKKRGRTCEWSVLHIKAVEEEMLHQIDAFSSK